MHPPKNVYKKMKSGVSLEVRAILVHITHLNTRSSKPPTAVCTTLLPGTPYTTDLIMRVNVRTTTTTTTPNATQEPNQCTNPRRAEKELKAAVLMRGKKERTRNEKHEPRKITRTRYVRNKVRKLASKGVYFRSKVRPATHRSKTRNHQQKYASGLLSQQKPNKTTTHILHVRTSTSKYNVCTVPIKYHY